MRKRTMLALLGLCAGLGSAMLADELPEGVEQILERGKIAAILDPEFVTAEEAEIADDAWVLGVEIDGQARAYSLNLLNRHEVVNDQVGETLFAAVWWPLANTAVVYDRKVGNKELNFEASGALLDASLVMRDRETDSWWSIMTSDAIGGELDGIDLVELPRGEKATWEDWHERYPNTLVLSVDGEEHIDNNPYDNYFASEATFRDLQIDDHRLAPKDSIYSFWWGDEPYAVPHTAFAGGRVLEIDGWGDQRLFLYRGEKASIFESTEAWVVPASLTTPGMGSKKLLALLTSGQAFGAESLPGFDTFWYNWVSVNGNTRLLP